MPVLDPSAASYMRAHLPSERVRVGERAETRAWLRMVIVPEIEQLADPAGEPSRLRALAAAQAHRLRAELEATDVPDEDEDEWVRGHLHDTALQILEFIAGDGFGTGLSAQKIATLASGAARDLRRWIGAGERPHAQLMAELERVTAEARALGASVRLVVGELGPEPGGEPVSALSGAVREAVTNARKHAHASQVIVRVSAGKDGGIAVTVTDDGVGFDPELAGGGLGLERSIFGRMRRAGGSASVDRVPGGGTCVTLLAKARS